MIEDEDMRLERTLLALPPLSDWLLMEAADDVAVSERSEIDAAFVHAVIATDEDLL
ncbi:hypothetical protein [Streptomyces sp. NPDC001903]|uniref:hypothetical protein n=1 Tax=Streptomyces sp. NPDC001903 TaxID=3364622 RepID=UPI0036C59C24